MKVILELRIQCQRTPSSVYILAVSSLGETQSHQTRTQLSSALCSNLGGPPLVLYGLHHPSSPVAARRVTLRWPRCRRAELRCHIGAGNDAFAVCRWCTEQHDRLCSFQTAQGVPPAWRRRGLQLCRVKVLSKVCQVQSWRMLFVTMTPSKKVTLITRLLNIL